ncbi:unnamed protein product [Orchesella dallaii]|uniref:Uncharacterized protein n=1 Tax=Orchesella dallaii TaxID=48710 RepID=A0ABP1RBK0_9HEXA
MIMKNESTLYCIFFRYYNDHLLYQHVSSYSNKYLWQVHNSSLVEKRDLFCAHVLYTVEPKRDHKILSFLFFLGICKGKVEGGKQFMNVSRDKIQLHYPFVKGYNFFGQFESWGNVRRSLIS